MRIFHVLLAVNLPETHSAHKFALRHTRTHTRTHTHTHVLRCLMYIRHTQPACLHTLSINNNFTNSYSLTSRYFFHNAYWCGCVIFFLSSFPGTIATAPHRMWKSSFPSSSISRTSLSTPIGAYTSTYSSTHAHTHENTRTNTHPTHIRTHTRTSNSKELIPEFFYQPHYLCMFTYKHMCTHAHSASSFARSCSHMQTHFHTHALLTYGFSIFSFTLGTRQNGERIGDVELPPWAKTPQDFVRYC